MRILDHILFLLLLILKLSNIYAEQCTTNDIVSDDGLNLQLPYRNESERYQVFYEQMNILEEYSNEVHEYYDGLNNIGVTFIKEYSHEYAYYSYFDSDEFLYTSDGVCSVYNLTYYVESATPFHLITVNGKPHIATPLNLLSHGAHENVAYLGSKDRYVRGIPVRQWLACTRLHGSGEYVKVIISYSNPEKWSTAFQMPGYESVPVHIDVKLSKSSSGRPTTHEQFNIYAFQPGSFGEELLYVPPGYNCENRYVTKKFPTIPKSYSFISNFIEVSMEGYGNSYTLRNEYDLDKNLIKMDYIGNDKEGQSRIVNLNSRLEYNINKITGSCSITSLNQLQELEFDIFRPEETPPYIYTGQRIIKGVNTDVWIAYRYDLDNIAVDFSYEWYFMADGWNSENFGDSTTQVPYQLIIYDYNQTIYEISDFRANTFNAYNIDLSDCRKLDRKHLSFSITDEKNYEAITKNKLAFKEAILIALEKYAKISVVRISKLHIIYESGVIRPKFTLLDKSNVSLIDRDLDLEESYLLLTAQINNRRFNITFKDSNKKVNLKEITVQADSESLVLLEQNYAQTVYSNQKPVSSGMDEGLFIGLIIAGIVVGILFGLLAGLYYHNRKLKKANASNSNPMTSLRNPNDNF